MSSCLDCGGSECICRFLAENKRLREERTEALREQDMDRARGDLLLQVNHDIVSRLAAADGLLGRVLRAIEGHSGEWYVEGSPFDGVLDLCRAHLAGEPESTDEAPHESAIIAAIAEQGQIKPAPVCETCGGSGRVLRHSWVTVEGDGREYGPCPYCKPKPVCETCGGKWVEGPMPHTPCPECGEGE